MTFERLIRVGITLLGFAFLAVGLADNLNFTVDDSFISLRYAENLAAGRGLVYNPGERVEGFSNPIWTLALAGLAKAGWSQRVADFQLLGMAKLLGIAFAVLGLLLLWWAVTWGWASLALGECRQVMPLALLGTGTTFSYSLWATSGLETPLAAFVVTAGALALGAGLKAEDARPGSGRAWLVTGGVFFGLHGLVRPEAIFVWGLALVLFLVSNPGPARKAALLSAIPTVLITVGILIVRQLYYDTWIPNSVVAKTGGGVISAILGLKYALSGIATTVGVLGIGLLGLGSIFRAGPHWRFILSYCAAHLLFIAGSGGDWMPGYRFHVPALILMWLAGTAALAAFLRAHVESRHWNAAVLLMAVLLGATFFGGRSLARSQWVYPTGLKGISWDCSPARVSAAKEIRSIVAPNDTLALFEAGYIPYFNPDLHVVDLSGLMEPSIARMPGLHMHKMTVDYFLERSPRFYLTMVKFGRPSGDGLLLLRSSEFQARYELIRYIESRKRGLAAAAEQSLPPIEEDVDFALYRRRL